MRLDWIGFFIIQILLGYFYLVVVQLLFLNYLSWPISQFTLCFILFIYLLHWYLFFSNPGKVCLPKLSKSERKMLVKHPRYCHLCKWIKTPSIHHCSRCHACIRNLDHHCPILYNCVGYENRKTFIVFLFWSFILVCWAIYLCYILQYTTFYILFAYTSSRIKFLQLCLIFFAFWIALMVIEQLLLISNRLTKLESLQARKCPSFQFNYARIQDVLGFSVCEWIWPW